MQYALVSSTCKKITRRNMTLAVERDVKQQISLSFEANIHTVTGERLEFEVCVKQDS